MQLAAGLEREIGQDVREGSYIAAGIGGLLWTANLANVAIGMVAQMIVEPGNATYLITSGIMEGDYDKLGEGSARLLVAAVGMKIMSPAAAPAGSGGQAGSQGFQSFSAFKRAMGPAGEGQAWHHVVEQTPGNVARFGPEAIHNTSNVMRLPHGAGSIHARLSGLYSSIRPAITGSESLTVRQWLSGQSFEAQKAFGLKALENISGGLW